MGSRDVTVDERQSPRYRPSVAAIIRDSAGRVLIGERGDTPGGWQFPQGGVEPGEAREEALARELVEEIGLEPGGYELGPCKGPYRYLFPSGRTKHGFNGQEQHYFLLSLLPSGQIEIARGVPEFRAVRWITPAEFQLAWLPEMKRKVYQQVFSDFFGLNLS